MSEFGNGVRRIIIYQTDLPKIVNIILRSCFRQSRTRIHSAYVHTLRFRIFITYYFFFEFFAQAICIEMMYINILILKGVE